MNKGYIQVRVSMAREARPIKNCTVVISRTINGSIVFEKTLYSDESGKTEIIEVDAPPKELSQTPQTKILPYDIYDISVKAEGYVETLIQGVQVFSEITAIQKVDMQPLEEGKTYQGKNVIIITPNQLVLNATRDKQRGPTEDFVSKVIKDPYIPKYITVHLGAPTSYAENVTVTFPEYIKNVASSEIFPTWPEESIRANVYAQISFALNRIYTEWYRGKGYDFEITNSTAYDQYFIKGRNIFDNINRLVDEIFQQYIARIQYKEPLFAQFCNGTTVTCKGMSQWGTVDLANKGYIPFDILKYYYGDNIELRTADIVDGIPESYPGYLLRLGSSGESVEILQRQLNRISQNYPAIPKIYPVDGDFGKNTEEAVKTFQRIFGLTQDGIVGRSTWYRISFIYVAVKNLAELESEGETEEEEDYCGYPGYLLRVGSAGEEVKRLQRFLNEIADFYTDIPKVEVDGIFGKNTENAVITFQEMFELSPDGIVGKDTWKKLCEVYKNINEEKRKDTQYKYPGYPLKEGEVGEEVRRIQYYLSNIADSYSSIRKIKVDGSFGSDTKNAVIDFQSYFGLSSDGIVGPTTWGKIQEVFNNTSYGRNENERGEKNLYEDIKFGDHSAYIRVLQTYINTIAWEIKDMKITKVKIDGKFGEETLKAINTIQKYFNIKVSKIVDKEMWTKLSDMYNIHCECEEKNKEKHKKNKGRKRSKSNKCR